MTTTVAYPSPAVYPAAGAGDEAATLDRPAARHPAWRHVPLAGLLLGTALLYLVGLSKSGWANQFYAAAAEAGSKSWTAFLFGSLDWSNFITVDKPPASLWIMDISVRIFGLNSWSILVPQALEGVAAVAILYAAVKRVSTPTAGLLAGAVLATTPVATLMFRYDNPDALLVLLMTAAAYATVRSLEHARGRWLILAGALVGFAFLTKMLQGLLVVPAFALAYLVAAPTALATRIKHVLAAGVAMVVAAGWWIALVELFPSSARPYIGGSTDNNILELTFGYNGFGRLTGASNNGNVGGGAGGFSSGETGLTRLFGNDMGSQISWLIPAALVALASLIWLTANRARTDALRASAIIWGGWLLVTGLVLSYASGIIHPYYTVALAPAIAALVGIGVVSLWRERGNEIARCLLACVIAAGAWWTFELLGRTDWNSWLRWLVLLSGAAAAAVALIPALNTRRASLLIAPAIALTLLSAPTAYALDTASTAHTGAIPSAGPASAGGFGAGGGPGGGRGGPGGGFGGNQAGGTTNGNRQGGQAPGRTNGQTNGRPGGGGAGGLGGATTVSSALKSAFAVNAGHYEWVAATTDDNEAASLELGTGQAVMSLGGYNGTDPAITLTAFEKLVSAGKIHYYVADASGFIGSDSAQASTAYQIEQWVQANYTSQTIGATTVYDLAS
jgi:4-amino-4-deoxy-L-arabinose transferase-like glycosyltransferase